MSTPSALRAVLEQRPLTRGLPAEVERVAERYAYGIHAGDGPAMRSAAEREAYLHARMPSTSAAVATALSYADLSAITSVLDLGSGPGSALWAVAEHATMQQITALEGDDELIRLGQDLARDHVGLAHTAWIRADLRHLPKLDAHDLVIISYALNELEPATVETLLTQAWDLTRHSLLIVEPGSHRGSAIVIQARQHLLARGAQIRAPCTHRAVCPLHEDKQAWCHFRVRVARSQAHRAAKGGTLGWEDEPFSFLLCTRDGSETGGSRIIGHPRKHGAGIDLPLCSAQGALTPTVTRNDPTWATARRARWGDHWEG